MHPFSVWAVYMHVGVCCQGVYSGFEMCTAVIMRFHTHIWDFWCFSAVTDVSVDYLTGFYNKRHMRPSLAYPEQFVQAKEHLISGQFGFAVVVIKRSGGPYFLEIAREF